MKPLKNTHLPKDASASQGSATRLAQVALKIFFGIAEEWQLSTKEQRILLGDLPEATYFKWKSTLNAKPGRDILERISHLQNIYKALRIIFPTLEQATAWPRKPNAAFGGKSALEVMLNGSILDLARVHDYVDGARGW